MVDPGAVFNGAVLADGARAAKLELAGTTACPLAGFGTSIAGFTTISEDAHAHRVLAGSIGGAGTIDLGASATLTLGRAVSLSRIAFSAAGGDTLVLSSPAAVASSLTGFGRGDVVDIEGMKANSLSYGGGVLTVYEDHVRADALVVSGADGGRFGLASDGHGGTDIMFAAAAFLPSTVVLPRLASSNADQIVHRFGAHMLL